MTRPCPRSVPVRPTTRGRPRLFSPWRPRPGLLRAPAAVAADRRGHRETGTAPLTLTACVCSSLIPRFGPAADVCHSRRSFHPPQSLPLPVYHIVRANLSERHATHVGLLLASCRGSPDAIRVEPSHPVPPRGMGGPRPHRGPLSCGRCAGGIDPCCVPGGGRGDLPSGPLTYRHPLPSCWSPVRL